MDEGRPTPEDTRDYVQATLEELQAATSMHLEKIRTLKGGQLKVAVQEAQEYIEMLGMDPEPW